MGPRPLVMGFFTKLIVSRINALLWCVPQIQSEDGIAHGCISHGRLPLPWGIITHRLHSWLCSPDILHSTLQHWKLPSRKGISVSVLAWLFYRLQSRCVVSLVAGLTIWFWWATKTSGNDPIGVSLTNNSWGGISCLVLGFFIYEPMASGSNIIHSCRISLSKQVFKNYIFKQVCKIVGFSMTSHASLVLVIFPHSHRSFVPPHSYPCLNTSVPRTPTLYCHITCVLSLLWSFSQRRLLRRGCKPIENNLSVGLQLH